MSTWKDRTQNILYIHHRWLTALLYLTGGVVGFLVVYLFLYTTAPVEDVQEQGSEVKINTGALERVTVWNTKKQADGKFGISIPNTSFAIPSTLP